MSLRKAGRCAWEAGRVVGLSHAEYRHTDATRPHRALRLQVLPRPPDHWAIQELHIHHRSKWRGQVKPHGRHLLRAWREERGTKKFSIEGLGV